MASVQKFPFFSLYVLCGFSSFFSTNNFLHLYIEYCPLSEFRNIILPFSQQCPPHVSNCTSLSFLHSLVSFSISSYKDSLELFFFTSNFTVHFNIGKRWVNICLWLNTTYIRKFDTWKDVFFKLLMSILLYCIAIVFFTHVQY